MELGDSVEEAGAHAAAALEMMAQLEVPPTPNNFCLWYSHRSGRYPDLSRVLQALERRGPPLGDAHCAELYERYFGTGREAQVVEESCRRLQDTLACLLARLDGLNQDTGAYGARLAEFEGELGRPKGLEEIRQLLGGILAQTSEMQRRTMRLEAEVGNTAREMAVLREDLASAQREANTDALTGIANRKRFNQVLRLAVQDAGATGAPMALLLLDIDHFKLFNDTHGHQIGDQVLRVVAQTLTRCSKGRDLPARYGGEEFALVLPQTDVAGARTLAEQIRETVSNSRVRLKLSGRCLGGITLSIGGAQYEPGEPISLLIRRADQALYRAKRMGRDRVVVASLDDEALARAAS